MSRRCSPLALPMVDAKPAVATVEHWLECIKVGYSRFAPAFAASGVEDEADLRALAVDAEIMADVEAALSSLDARLMHVRNIRLSLQALCQSEPPRTPPSYSRRLEPASRCLPAAIQRNCMPQSRPMSPASASRLVSERWSPIGRSVSSMPHYRHDRCSSARRYATPRRPSSRADPYARWLDEAALEAPSRGATSLDSQRIIAESNKLPAAARIARVSQLSRLEGSIRKQAVDDADPSISARLCVEPVPTMELSAISPGQLRQALEGATWRFEQRMVSREHLERDSSRSDSDRNCSQEVSAHGVQVKETVDATDCEGMAC